MGELQMKGILKRGGFAALTAAILWCATGCSHPYIDNQTFDELGSISFNVFRATVFDTFQDIVAKPFPYCLYIELDYTRMPYAYYSDEECTVRLREETLVTVNGKPPAGPYRTLAENGLEFEVYLDFLPEEGDVVKFNQEWFFAKSYKSPYERYKARIETESVPINFRLTKTEEE
jgi:hypothetical protein